MPPSIRLLLAAFAAIILVYTAPWLVHAEIAGTEEAVPPVEAEVSGEEEKPEGAEAGQCESGSGEVSDLGEIEVTAPEMAGRMLPGPLAIESFSVDELLRGGQEDLTALTRIPWINKEDYFGGQAISLMGLSAKFTRILIDGKHVPGFIDQKLDASQLTLSGIERIEVIKGPVAAQYGSGAVAGVINLVTRRAGPKFSLRNEMRAGSNGFNSQSLEMGKEGKKGGYFISFNRRQRNAFDMNPRTVETDGDAYNSSSLSYRLGRKLNSKWAVSLQGSYMDEFAHNIQSAFGGFPRRGEFDTERFGINGSIAYTPKPNLTYSASYHYGDYDRRHRSYFTTITPEMLSEDSFREVFSELELSLSASNMEEVWQAGLVLGEDRMVSERIFDERASLEAKSAYASWERFYGDCRALSLGIRADDHSLAGFRFSPKLSYWQRLSGKADIRLGYGQGFRAPSIKELYFNYNSPFGFSVRGNPLLEEETANALTAVFTYSPSQSESWELGVFYEWLEGTITATEILSSPLTYKKVNLGRTYSRGLTLSHRRNIGEKWDLVIDQALMDAADLDTGARLPHCPRYRASLTLRHSYRQDGWLELICSATSPRYTSIENEQLAPGYVTLDAHWNIPTDWGVFAFSACNLTGRTNRQYGPKPGRELFITFARSF